MSRDLILLALALLTWGLGEGMFFQFQPLYLQQLGADPTQIGGILGSVGVAMTVTFLPAGFLSDRFGRRPLLYASWIIGTVAAWIMALAPSLPLFVSGSILYGFTNFVLVPLNSYVTAARRNVSVGRALTLISASFNLGAVLGPLLGGWIGDLFGMQRSFLIAAILFIISTLLVFTIQAQPVEQGEEDTSLRAIRNMIQPRFVQYLLVVFVVMFVLYLPQPLSPNFLQNERGLTLTQIGQLVAVTGLGVVVLNLVLGQLNAQLGFILAQAAMGLFALFLWRGQTLLWFFPAYFLLGSYRTARSLAVAQGRSLVRARNMGVAYGWIETAASMAIILAPPLAGWLYSLEPALVYPVSMVLISGAIIFTWRTTPLRAEEIL